jgi:hypothetical protein
VVTKSMEGIFAEACLAAEKAREAHIEKLTPMIVGSAIGLSDEIDYSKKTYYVQGGACGFASVVITPARGKFVTWAKTQGRHGRSGCGLGRTSDYYGGYWIGSGVWFESRDQLSQSLELNEVICRAAADVLTAYGIKCYVDSRMD